MAVILVPRVNQCAEIHKIIYSSFTVEGKQVNVKTACHPSSDAIGVSVSSDLIKEGRIKVFFDFPYPDSKQFADYIGNYNRPKAHTSTIETQSDHLAIIVRTMDDIK